MFSAIKQNGWIKKNQCCIKNPLIMIKLMEKKSRRVNGLKTLPYAQSFFQFLSSHTKPTRKMNFFIIPITYNKRRYKQISLWIIFFSSFNLFLFRIIIKFIWSAYGRVKSTLIWPLYSVYESKKVFFSQILFHHREVGKEIYASSSGWTSNTKGYETHNTKEGRPSWINTFVHRSWV